MFGKIKERGISLKAAHRIMLAVTLLISAVLIAEIFLTTSTYQELSDAADNYIQLQKSAYELMNASDYLTQEVQCYTVNAERSHMDNYFEEADVKARREDAIHRMSELDVDEEAFNQLKLAMQDSLDLMNTEFYAMRLVCEAQHDGNMPSAVKAVTLSAEDEALSDEGKMKKARELVHGDAYNKAKSTIRFEMNNCLDRLEASVRTAQISSDKRVKSHSLKLRILIVIETISIIAALWMTSRLVINPMIHGVNKIKADSPLDVNGSAEFRYLAKTYNKMYDAFKRDIANLNYDASHDKLTGVYNRAGYDVLRQNVDIKTTAMLLIDADNFKTINDTYGHTIGDCVLKKIANTLTQAFRSEDHVCRLGGDEFAVFMLHVTGELSWLIERKVNAINDLLRDPTRDSVPAVSLSVGIAFGEHETDITALTKHADEALYKVKENGRCGCAFYLRDADSGAVS